LHFSSALIDPDKQFSSDFHQKIKFLFFYLAQSLFRQHGFEEKKSWKITYEEGDLTGKEGIRLIGGEGEGG
jgi:hypothetical protein